MVSRTIGLSIQSKVLLMLLLVSVLSAAVVGGIGISFGRDSLRQAALDQLMSVRESRAREVTRTMESIRSAVVLDSRNSSSVDAARAFDAGFDELLSTPLDAAQAATVDSYYADVFVPQLEERTGTESDPSVFLPDSEAQRYLQYYYTTPFTDFDEAIKLDDAGDGSAWSAAHARYHDYFREMTTQLGYEDALIIDPDGNVVYSVYGGVDLGTNVVEGPYAGGALSDVFERALESNSIDSAFLTDFDRYQPSLNVPTAWAASPIGSDGEVVGILAVQLPIEAINSVMTGAEHWEQDGLGDTGEVYLAGPDETMRSASRLLTEDPEQFENDVVAAGTSPEIAAREVAVSGTILLQPVATQAVERALGGKTGTIEATDYLGAESLAAYAPLDVPDLEWVIVAKTDAYEAYQPVADFTRSVLLWTAGIVLVVSLLSLLFAQAFTRPVRELVSGVRRIGAGETGIEVDASARDEFGDLGVAFNDMSRSLQLKADLIEAQRGENEKLLLTLMPASAARRYQEGEETISEDHQDVSVVFADLVGSDELFSELGSTRAVAALNTIVRGFDEAAERLGIDRVRTLRDGYLASCGLVIPRVDNVRRALDYAVEMREVVDRFNRANGTELSIKAGVDAGTVSSGLIGRETVAYDMWGEAVNIANAVRGASAQPGIFVSDRVHERLGESYPFERTSAMADGLPVWELSEAHRD